MYKKISAKMFQFQTNVRDGDNEAELRGDEIPEGSPQKRDVHFWL